MFYRIRKNSNEAVLLRRLYKLRLSLSHCRHQKRLQMVGLGLQYPTFSEPVEGQSEFCLSGEFLYMPLKMRENGLLFFTFEAHQIKFQLHPQLREGRFQKEGK